MKRKQWIRQIRAVLLRRRDALRRSLSDPMKEPDSSEEPRAGDVADAAMEALYGEISSQLAETEARELARIENALEQLEEGNYGVCESCGRDIPLARLQALPYATTCIRCQRELERDTATRRSTVDLGTRLWSTSQVE